MRYLSLEIEQERATNAVARATAAITAAAPHLRLTSDVVDGPPAERIVNEAAN